VLFEHAIEMAMYVVSGVVTLKEEEEIGGGGH
jgi:hypothetical protein